MINYKKLKEFISEGKFDEAHEIIKEKNQIKILNTIEEYFIENSSIIFYGFLNYLLTKDHNNAKLHYVTSSFCATGINHFGGYPIGYYHIKKAIELEPENLQFKKFALLYNDIPDKLLPNKIAKKYKSEIKNNTIIF